MFKLVVLSAFIAVAAAGYISPVAYTVAENHGYAKVGEIVENVPTAVSHQSSTIVHNKAARITPLVAPVVQKQIVESPVVYNSYAPEQLVYSAPSVAYKTVAAPQTYVYSAAPVVQKTIVDGSSFESKTYVAEPDSVRYTEQSQSTPTKYVYSSPVVQYAAPAVQKQIVESPVVYNSYAPEQLVYSAPSVAYKTVAAPQTYVYSAAPVVQKTIDDGSSFESKTYVAEPDSVRYTEQSQSTPTKYVYSSPVVQYAAPAVKYVSGPAYYSAPVVHAW
jgi:hypothetical protein